MIKLKSKPTNFNSRKFKRRLKKVNKEIAEIEKSMRIDPIKLLKRFTI